MGWKSTLRISKERALKLIQERVESLSNEQLEDLVEHLGYGNDCDLAYYGYNFIVSEESDEREEYERLKAKYG